LSRNDRVTVRRISKRAAGVLLLLLGACTSNNKSKAPFQVGSDDGGSGASPDGGMVMITPSGTVKVKIDMPVGGSIEPNTMSILVSATITVDGADLIDLSSVSVSLVGHGATVSSGKLVNATGQPNEFAGQLSLAGVPRGGYAIVVSAASTKGASNQDTVDVVVDTGPQITVISPTADGHYKGTITVQFVTDTSEVSVPQAWIGGFLLPVMSIPGAPGQYQATFDFTSLTPPLSGEQVFEVSASHPDGAKTDIKTTFVVDNVGPQITMTAPIAGAVVGGIITLSANIVDDAGVDLSSLRVVIGDQGSNPLFELPLSQDPKVAATYTALFDTRNLTGCKPLPDPSLCIVYPTLSFRAADKLGNATKVAYEIAVDNVGPIADLVPPQVRDRKIDGSSVRCSHLFDPLSPQPSYVSAGDMPDDLCRVPQVFDLRARVEDDGNHATGLKLVPISLVDPSATAVYVLDDISQPLVVDTDGDGNCDAINPLLVPTTAPLSGSSVHQVLKVRLSPVPPAGSADFTMDPTLPATAPCAQGRDLGPPLPLCGFFQPTIAIGYTVGREPAIWAVDPVTPAYCLGGQFDTRANNIGTNGWKCIAVATADLNGNTSVSAPIRVWVDYNYDETRGPCAAPPVSTASAPPCTGIYNPSTNTVTGGACQARKFAPGELCLNGNCL
jgi:Bacterial Ig domain